MFVWRVSVLFWMSLWLVAPAIAATSLRFFGGGVAAPDADRVKIRIDADSTSLGGPPADIGSEDVTLEFWMRGSAADNDAGAVTCGANINWINGNIIVDRDRFNQDQKFGISIAGGVVVFGVSGDGTGDRTICATTNVVNDAWHHIAVQRTRANGAMSLYVDGTLEASASAANGPDGDISYPDNGVPGNFCGDGNDPCTGSDPFLVLAAEKHDAGAEFPSFNGYMDELRLSNSLRYSSNFTPSATAFTTDGNTVALYHFDEGVSTTINDTSGAAGGPSPGVMNVGGSPTGPLWSANLTAFGQAAEVFVDDFNRADNAALGNSWVEKAATTFSIVGTLVSKPNGGSNFRSNLVYRPSGEDLLDVEASLQFRLNTTSALGFPQVFVRGQSATIATASVLDGYILFINDSTTEAILFRSEGSGGSSLATIALSPALTTTDDYRLRLRSSGTNPVAVTGWVERWDGDSWAVIGTEPVDDSSVTRYSASGAVGFSGHTEAGTYVYDLFTRTSLTIADTLAPDAPANLRVKRP